MGSPWKIRVDKNSRLERRVSEGLTGLGGGYLPVHRSPQRMVRYFRYGPAQLGHLSLARHLTASQTVWIRRVLPALPKLMHTGRSKWICLIALPNVCRSRTFRKMKTRYG